MNLSLLLNNDGKKKTLSWSERVAKFIIYYAVFVLIGICIFAQRYGIQANMSENDRKLKNSFPELYRNIPLIGVRKNWESATKQGLDADELKRQDLNFLSTQCTSFIIYLLIGLYFRSKYSKMISRAKNLEQIGEKEFKKIFEFHYQYYDEDSANLTDFSMKSVIK